MSCAKTLRRGVALVLGDGEAEPVLAEDVALLAPEHRAALAVDQQHAALGVEDDDHRPRDVEVALRAVALAAQHLLHAAALVGLQAAALEVLGELARDGGEHRRHLRVGLRDVGGEELDHARAVVGERDGEGDRGGQPGADGVAVARHVPVGAHAPRPTTGGGRRTCGRAARGRGRSAAAGDLGEGGDLRAGAPGRATSRCSAACPRRRPGARRRRRSSPCVSPERLQHARAQLVGLEAGGDVVGDRLLGEQEPVGLVALAALGEPLGEDRLEHLGQPRGVRREDGLGPEALDEGREVAGAHGGDRGDEGELGVGDADERGRLARGHGIGPLAAVDHDVPAAPGERGGERLGARDGVRVRQRPAGGAQRVGDLLAARRLDVDEQRSEGTVHPHTSVIGGRRNRLTLAGPAIRPRGAGRRAARARRRRPGAARRAPRRARSAARRRRSRPASSR